MRHGSFAGKSIPADFSMMSVRDIRIALEIIEQKVLEAEKINKEKLIGKNIKAIPIPLRCLAETCYVEYTVSIEIGKIKKALKEIRIYIEALIEFEKDFFVKVKEENKAFKKEGKKNLGRSIPFRVASVGGWPSS